MATLETEIAGILDKAAAVGSSRAGAAFAVVAHLVEQYEPLIKKQKPPFFVERVSRNDYHVQHRRNVVEHATDRPTWVARFWQNNPGSSFGVSDAKSEAMGLARRLNISAGFPYGSPEFVDNADTGGC